MVKRPTKSPLYMSFRSLFETHLGLVKQNAQILRRMTRKAFFCPMLKANAYGHGAGPVAKALQAEGVQQAGALSLEEALDLKKSAPSLRVLIFGPLLSKEEMFQAVREPFIPVCGNWEELALLSSLKKPARIHLKWDTGFSRLGFPLKEKEKLYDFLKARPYIQLKGMATQILSNEELGDPKSPSFRQLSLFNSLKALFPKIPLHALNTAGLFAFEPHSNRALGARPGIGLYGIQPQIPSSKEGAKKLKLKPVSCLKTSVVSVRQLKKGDRVSYGGLWRAKKNSCIATLALGYGDGFLRGQRSVKELLFRGRRRRVVGKICMDFMMLDVTQDNQKNPVKIGEEAVLFGWQKQAFLPPEEQALACGATVYELFSQWTKRVQRSYIEPSLESP